MAASAAASEICLPVRLRPDPSAQHPRPPVLFGALSDSGLGWIADIPPTLNHALAFGDTDHDGRNEVVLSSCEDATQGYYVILEAVSENVYVREYVSSSSLIPYAVGDLDKDGKMEIIGQAGGAIRVYEALDQNSYPTQLVWSSPSLANVVGYTAIGDTDGDGNMEIIHSINGFTGGSDLAIYECTGDNAYSLKFRTRVDSSDMGEKAIADLDGDGLREICFSGFGGRVYVFEAKAYDVWQLVWSDTTELWHAYAAEAGADTDGNGKPELFITGNRSVGGLAAWTTLIYESAGDDSLVRVAALDVVEDVTGEPANELGRLASAGPTEILMDGYAGFWVYRGVAPGQWQAIEQVPDPHPRLWHLGLYAYDANANGRDEVFWSTDASRGSSLIFERPPTTADVSHAGLRKKLTLSITPNPCRAQAQVWFENAGVAARWLSVLDVRGRLVQRLRLDPERHEGVLWPAGSLPAGVYFLRLENLHGATLAKARGVVVR